LRVEAVVPVPTSGGGLTLGRNRWHEALSAESIQVRDRTVRDWLVACLPV
jgi:hypothetical protein